MVYGWYNSTLAVPGAPFNLTLTTDVDTLLDANTDLVGGVFLAETTSAITHVGFRQATAVGSPPPTMRISLQGVASGVNDGTVKGGGSPASATFVPSAANDGTWVWVALDNAYTPSLGEKLCWVIDYSSGTIGASNNLTVRRANAALNFNSTFPYSFQNTTGSTGKQSGGLWGYKTASARYGRYCQSVTMEALSTSGHRRALAFTFDGEGVNDFKLIGGNFVIDFPASGNVKFGLWSAGGLLASTTLTSDEIQSGTVDRVVHIYFDTYATLTPGTKYYLGCEADGNTFEIGNLTFAEDDDIGAWVSDYTKLALATFDGSSWSETATQTPMIQPIIQAVTGVSGGGSGVPGNLVGGIHQ